MRSEVSLPREHYNAVRRVLKLLSDYLGAMPEGLHGFGGGLMTTDELRQQTTAARALLRVKREKRSPRGKPECAGCGFSHAPDYKDCVWNKNPY